MSQSCRVCLVGPEEPGVWMYLAEILRHAGLPFHVVATGQAAELFRRSPPKVIVVPGSQSLPEAAAEALAGAVEAGAALICVGGTGGLERVLGVRAAGATIAPPFEPTGEMAAYKPPTFGITVTRHVGEGYLKRRLRHAITAGMSMPLHVFSASGAVAEARDVSVLADLLDVHAKPLKLAGLTARRFGAGMAVFLAPDVARTVSLIQQGRFIDQDGFAASDGSAPINDRILKAEDGLVLDWTFDRRYAEELGCAAFLVPQADQLREVFVRSILWSAMQVQAALPVLWYHPGGRDATAMLSMDSDGNRPDQAYNAIELLRRLHLPATLCAMAPGYPRDVFDALRAGGIEIALHYDAMTPGSPDTTWGRETFLRQFHGLKQMAGLERIISNKNHFTRWEGRLEFFEWCEQVGIEADQSRGPSKRGTTGYPFGSCHPWRPIRENGSILDVFEVPLNTQDVPVTAPTASLQLWLKGALANHGVMHILFHPAHLDKTPMSQALSNIVADAREQGMVWQRCDEIVAWHRARYAFAAEPGARGWLLRAEQPLKEACLLVFGAQGNRAALDGKTARTRKVRRFGLPCVQVVADLAGETSMEMG